jgi:hypothetical protein
MDIINVPSTFTENSPRLIQSFALPHFGETMPGPLHTIVTDSNGSIYYSDEINHAVVSLNGDGSVRWHKMQRGAAPGEFYYPRGLSIGCIQWHGKILHCLAVADAWNRRVQFLDFDGNVLAVWTQGGEMPFGEVADVRFIQEGTNSKAGEAPVAFWYVLDRGNHRLVKLGIDGIIVNQIGRPFPHNLENRWAAPEMFFGEAYRKDDNKIDVSPLDFIHHPDGILGNTLDWLCISEANSRRLKHVLPPHLIPLQADLKGDLEWIAADSSGFLGWDRSARRLIRYGEGREQVCEAAVLGLPVHYHQRSDEFWIQNEANLFRYGWDESRYETGKKGVGKIPFLMIRATEEDLLDLDTARVEDDLGKFLSVIDRELEFAEKLLSASSAQMDQKDLKSAEGAIPIFQGNRAIARERLYKTLNRWCIGHLRRKFLNNAFVEAQDHACDIDRIRSIYAEPIKQRIDKMQTYIQLFGEKLNGYVFNQTAVAASPDKKWSDIAFIANMDLRHVQNMISCWFGIQVKGP